MLDNTSLAFSLPRHPMTPKIRGSLGLFVSLLALGACAEPVAMLPPSDTYVNAEPTPRTLTVDEQKFIDGMNAELMKLGMPAATVGGYEMNAASVLVNLGLAKLYRGSNRAFAEDKSDDIAEVSPPGGNAQITSSVNTSVRTDPLGFLSEEGDIDLSRLHRDQHLTSRGMPFDFYSDVQVIPYEQRELQPKDLLYAARRAHFYPVYGQLRIGVAILVDGADDKRLYAVVLRDERLNVTKGVPRTIAPGGSFELAGQVIDRTLRPLMVGVQGPKSITLDPIEVQEDGSFHATIKLPDPPGLYVVSLGRAEGNDPVPYNVAAFAGIEPTPWPRYPKGKPPADALALAEQIGQAVTSFRQTYGLPVLTIPPNLAAFEKTEAQSYAEALRAARQGSATALADWDAKKGARAAAAGFDASHLDGRMVVLSNIAAQLLPARFPPDAIAAHKLAQPNVAELGLGVAVIPRTSDPSQPPYVVGWDLVLPAGK